MYVYRSFDSQSLTAASVISLPFLNMIRGVPSGNKRMCSTIRYDASLHIKAVSIYSAFGSDQPRLSHSVRPTFPLALWYFDVDMCTIHPSQVQHK